MVKDFKGNEYTSVSEMCSKYGIKKDLYIQRIAEGKSQKEALTEEAPGGTRNQIYGPMADHLYTMRNEMGLSQAEFGLYLSKITGYCNKDADLKDNNKNVLTLMMVSSVENSRRAYDLDVYIALATDQQISLDYIFGRTQNPKMYPPAKCFKTYYDRVRETHKDSIIDKLDLKKRGVESRLIVANELNVSLDYLCGLTDQMTIN